MKFILTNVSEQDLLVTLIDRPDGYFDLELPDKVEAGKTAEGVLKLHDDAVETSFEKSITIQVDDPDSSRFTIPIKRTIRSAETANAKAATKSK